MAGSTFGTIFKITTWGESHGKALGVVIDGCPARLPVFLRIILPWRPTRQMLSVFSFQGLFYPFNASRASIVAWCTGFPKSVISFMVISSPKSRPSSRSL